MMQEIKDIGYDNLTDATLLEYINDAYHEFCGSEPWPFLEKTDSSVTVDGVTGQITDPTDIRSVITIVDTTNGWKLRPVRRDQLTTGYPKELGKTGNGLFYYTVGNNYYIYPAPTGIAYVIDYLQNEPDLAGSDAPIFPAKHHRILIHLALEKAATGEDDTALAADYRAQYEQRYAKIRDDLWYKNYDETETIQDVYSSDDWDGDIY